MELETQQTILSSRRKSIFLVVGLILLNFVNLIFAACFLNSLGYTANYIPDLSQYWKSLLKYEFINKQLPIHSFLIGNLTLICYSFHQMNLLVMGWQLFFGGVIKRLKFECKL